jgi:hypothetical protein
VRVLNRLICTVSAATTLFAVSPLPHALATEYVCQPASVVCVLGSGLIEHVARYVGVADDIAAMFTEPTALPDGVAPCVLGVACDWWPAFEIGLIRSISCGGDAAMICDLRRYVDDPEPLLDAAQVTVVTDWIDRALGSGVTVTDLDALVDVVLSAGGADGTSKLLQFVTAAVVAVIYTAPDVGPSARANEYVFPVESEDGAVLVDPALDPALVEAQRKCLGQMGFGIWLDYSKEGFSNEILLRGGVTVNEVRLAPGSSSRCPVMSATVKGSEIIYATSNGGSALASNTKSSGLQSRSGTLKSTDRNQPRLVGVGPYYEWTTSAIDITIEWGLPPTPEIHLYRSPMGIFDLQASTFISLGGGYRFGVYGSTSMTIEWTCTKQGSDAETCRGDV